MLNKVKVGYFTFTEVLDGRHREYNEWHLLDHLPEHMKLDGVHWAQTWVSTPTLTERRLFSQGDLARSHYLTVRLVTEPVEQALDGMAALDRTLAALGRTFAGCRSHLSGPFEFVKAYASPRLLVAAEAIPYRPNLGLFVTAQDVAPDATEAALDEARQWYDQVHIPDLLGVGGVAGCWWCEAMPETRMARRGEGNPSGRTIRIYWLDEEPETFLDDLKAKTPDMQMIDLRPAYRTLLVGTYAAFGWPSTFDWFDQA